MDNMLNEISLSRLRTHLEDNRPIAILTGHRAERSQQENKKRNDEIKDLIRRTGYGFVPVKGAYIEKVDGKPVEVKEDSILIIGEQGKGDELERLAKKIGIKYEQDSVLFRDDKGSTVLISTRSDSFVGPIGSKSNLGRWAPNKESEYFTQMKNGSKFMFESIGDFLRKPITGFAEKMASEVVKNNYLKEE